MKLVYGAPNFYFLCTYHEKDTCKSVGFRWSPENQEPLPDRGIWWTADPSVAVQLVKYATPKAKEQLREESARRKASLEASRATSSDIKIPAPDNLDYMPFQKAGINFALSRPNTLFADEMGLGKTMEAIGVINADESIQHVLVICPASLKLNWERELRRWVVRGMTVLVANATEFFPIADIIIINYDILERFKDELAAQQWDILIVDECHYCKNPKTKRSRAVKAVRAARRLYLTGTPIVNRPIELWPIISQLDPATWNRFWAYAERYCGARRNPWGRGWDVTGASNLEELQRKLRSTIMVRRLKSEVLKELPPKVRQVIELPANGMFRIVRAEQDAMAEREEEMSALKAAVEIAKASEDPEDYKRAVAALRSGYIVAFAEMSKVRHDTAVAKVPQVIEFITKQVPDDRKVVIYAHHHDVIDALVDALMGNGVAKLDGRDSAERKQQAIDRFQNDPDCRVFVGSIQAAGLGITLTAASHVIFAELDWVPGNVTQSEDRLHRIGQHNSVLVQHLVLEGSLDVAIAKTIVRKQVVIDKALDDKAEPIDEPVVPLPQPATDSTSRTRIAEEAATLTPAQVEAIHAALKQLAATDEDRASWQNMIGFNKIDGRIGHSLATTERLTPKQAALGKRIVTKYSRQLGEDLMAAIEEKP